MPFAYTPDAKRRPGVFVRTKPDTAARSSNVINLEYYLVPGTHAHLCPAQSV